MGMHSNVHRGKRVRVKLNNGKVIISRFRERRAPYLFFDQDDGTRLKLHLKDIDSFGIYRAKESEEK